MSEPKTEQLAEGTLISHLLELRARLVKAAIAVAIAFAPCAYFSNKLLTLVAEPLMRQLPEGSKLITTSVVGSFMVPIKMAVLVALVIAAPVILYQAWAFVSPGLYKKEKNFAVPLLISSVTLFYCGVLFAYFLVMPLAFKFLIATTPGGIGYTPDIGNFVDFAMLFFLGFGAAFEIPVATVLLLWTGIVKFETLAKNRGYVMIGIAVVTAAITPPDAVSMLMMMVPMYILYEIGILAARFMLKDKIASQSTQST